VADGLLVELLNAQLPKSFNSATKRGGFELTNRPDPENWQIQKRFIALLKLPFKSSDDYPGCRLGNMPATREG
jgi:hypothetical protein